MSGYIPKQLGTGKIFLFCLGDFAKAILGGLLVTYLLKFFNITESSGLPLLLPPALIGTLRGADIIFDAIIDPWIASMSDKSKNARGRRIPFMRWMAVPYAVTCFLIFFPINRTAPGLANIIWVMAAMLAYSLFSSLYLIPYQALQTEVVTDTKRRVFFFTIQSLNFVIGSAVIYVLPVLVGVFRGSGLSALDAWQLSFLIFAVIGLIALIIPAFTIKEGDYVEPQQSYLPVFKSFASTLKYGQFRILIGAFLVMQVAFSFFNAALLFYIDVLLNLKESFATIVLGLSIVVGISTYPLVNRIARKFGKKPLLVVACISYAFIYLGIFFGIPISTFLGTAPITNAFMISLAGTGATVGQVSCGFLLGVLIAFPIACTNILPYAAFADITQYDTIVSGENKAGMFIAVRQFLGQFSSAIVTIIVSYVMYTGAANGYPTVLGVRLTALIASIVIAAALFLYLWYNDKEIVTTIDEHNAKLRAMAERIAV
jgi:GPH family glycoside/pentoside/hexuronide:cation symporter